MIDPTELLGAQPTEGFDPEASEPWAIDVADRVKNLPPYLFGKINEQKYKKRRKGIDIIDLGMGNPTDPPNELVIEKLREAVLDTATLWLRAFTTCVAKLATNTRSDSV